MTRRLSESDVSVCRVCPPAALPVLSVWTRRARARVCVRVRCSCLVRYDREETREGFGCSELSISEARTRTNGRSPTPKEKDLRGFRTFIFFSAGSEKTFALRLCRLLLLSGDWASAFSPPSRATASRDADGAGGRACTAHAQHARRSAGRERGAERAALDLGFCLLSPLSREVARPRDQHTQPNKLKQLTTNDESRNAIQTTTAQGSTSPHVGHIQGTGYMEVASTSSLQSVHRSGSHRNACRGLSTCSTAGIRPKVGERRAAAGPHGHARAYCAPAPALCVCVCSGQGTRAEGG